MLKEIGKIRLVVYVLAFLLLLGFVIYDFKTGQTRQGFHDAFMLGASVVVLVGLWELVAKQRQQLQKDAEDMPAAEDEKDSLLDR